MLCQLERPRVPDTLISTYADYLQHRDFLEHYRFNLTVLESLVNLTIDLWKTDKRINRLGLLTSIKQFAFQRKDDNVIKNPYSKQLNHRMFQLYRNTYEAAGVISARQLPEARKISNFLLIGASLPEEDQQWMLDNCALHDPIINRILRYPDKSPLISAWIRKHYYGNLLSERRAEATSWLIDEDPEFVFDRSLLLSDVEWLNLQDKTAIENHESQLALRDLVFLVNMENELVKKEDSQSIDTAEYAELKLMSRYHAHEVRYSKALEMQLPDLNSILEDYRNNTDFYHNSTMMWSIAFSRLDAKTKMQLIKKYYSEDTHRSFLKIAKQYKFVGLLKWLNSELN